MGNKLSYPEVDLSGKVVVVTGGNTGIGYATAKGLARLGAHTFIACRSKERAEAAIERMKGELGVSSGASTVREEGASGGAEAGSDEGEQVKSKKPAAPKVEYLPLDLSSFQSTKDFVRAFKEKDLPLHILINNAALAGPPYTKTDDGFEAQFQVNHLSHMLMTLELLPLLLETASQSGDGRILNVSSAGHYSAQPFNPTMLNKSEQNYKRVGEYCNTKLYNVMTSFALQRRLTGKNITVSSIHPGYVQTELFRGLKDMKVLAFLESITSKTIARKPDAGAATSLNCAVNPDLNSQQHFYYDSCRPKLSSADSRNEEFQEELWRRSFEFLKDHLSPDIVEKYGPKSEPEGGVASKPEGGEAPAGGDQQEVSAEATSPGEDSTQTDPKDSGEAPATSGDQQEGSTEITSGNPQTQ